MTEKYGILTMAYGNKRFLKMAMNLSMSLDFVGNKSPKAIVTDLKHKSLHKYFDYIIEYNPLYGNHHVQKVYIDQYSPFENTLFIDADSLVYKKIEKTWDVFKNIDFGVIGLYKPLKSWYFDQSQFMKKFNLTKIPIFNGGLYYFNRSLTSQKVFMKAKEISKEYYNLGIKEFYKGGISDEALISLSMAINNIPPTSDSNDTMRTPLGLKGKLNIDIMRNKVIFNKQSALVSPEILHFCGNYQIFHIYYREVAKLKAFKIIKNRTLTTVLITIIYSPMLLFDKLRIFYWKLSIIIGKIIKNEK